MQNSEDETERRVAPGRSNVQLISQPGFANCQIATIFRVAGLNATGNGPLCSSLSNRPLLRPLKPMKSLFQKPLKQNVWCHAHQRC